MWGEVKQRKAPRRRLLSRFILCLLLFALALALSTASFCTLLILLLLFVIDSQTDPRLPPRPALMASTNSALSTFLDQAKAEFLAAASKGEDLSNWVLCTGNEAGGQFPSPSLFLFGLAG